jgi:hypothetical protein
MSDVPKAVHVLLRAQPFAVFLQWLRRPDPAGVREMRWYGKNRRRLWRVAMTDVISALTIISVCSVLLVYWVIRMFQLCLAPTESTDETLESSKQAIKAVYGARFFGGMEFIVPHRTGPYRPAPARPSAQGMSIRS